MKSIPGLFRKLPTAGCKSLTTEELVALMDWIRYHPWDSEEEKVFIQGMMSGMCFLGVDNWENEYGQSFDKFAKNSFDIMNKDKEEQRNN